MVMDGSQIRVNDGIQESYTALATCLKMDNSALYSASAGYMLYDLAAAVSPDTNGKSIDGGRNLDAPDKNSQDAGQIRWRHQGNTTANFLFVDGHVEPRRYKSRTSVDLKHYNINVN